MSEETETPTSMEFEPTERKINSELEDQHRFLSLFGEDNKIPPITEAIEEEDVDLATPMCSQSMVTTGDIVGCSQVMSFSNEEKKKEDTYSVKCTRCEIAYTDKEIKICPKCHYYLDIPGITMDLSLGKFDLPTVIASRLPKTQYQQSDWDVPCPVVPDSEISTNQEVQEWTLNHLCLNNDQKVDLVLSLIDEKDKKEVLTDLKQEIAVERKKEVKEERKEITKKEKEKKMKERRQKIVDIYKQRHNQRHSIKEYLKSSQSQSPWQA